MSMAPFKMLKFPSAPPQATAPAPVVSAEMQQQMRVQIDRLQVLTLTKPDVAAWLMGFIDRFGDMHGIPRRTGVPL